jgi:uncharacterized membrane protein
MKKKSVSKNNNFKMQLTYGQKLADKITFWGGSWTFIIIFFVFLSIWIAINTIAMIERWDPYPFILLNLVLSCLAAIQAPIILMSQNREMERERLKMERDYAVNRKAEREVEYIKKELDSIKRLIQKKK